MKITSLPVFAAVAALGLCAVSAAHAQLPVLTGTDLDFVGITPVHVAYSATAPENNFVAGPVSSDDTVAYNVYLRGDSNYVYGLVEALPAAGDNYQSALGFSNLYLSTNPALGTNVGFEVNNSNGFIPGGMSGYNLAGTGFEFVTGTDSSGGDTVEFAMPWSFFTTDPLNMGFAKLTPGGTFQIRDSQTFGYTYVGGNDFGATRLGQITYTPAAAPEPSAFAALAIGLLGLGTLALQAKRRTA